MPDMTICEENRMRIDTIERSYQRALERLAEAEKVLIVSATRHTEIVGDIANIVTSLAQTPGVDRKALREVKKRLGTALLDVKPLVHESLEHECCSACKCGD